MRLEDSEFYLIRPPESEKCLCKYAPDGIIVREEINCSLNPKHARIGRYFSDLAVTVPCSPADDILFTWASECLGQEKVFTVFERHGLTGFWTKPAKAVMKMDGQSLPVRQLKVSGWGGIVPPESGIRQDKYCPECLLSHWTNLTNPEALISPDNWDGSDFFIIWPLPAFFFVTERVVRIFRESGFEGARFVKSFPISRVRMGYSPKPLSYSMPESRARQLRDAFGVI